MSNLENQYGITETLDFFDLAKGTKDIIAEFQNGKVDVVSVILKVAPILEKGKKAWDGKELVIKNEIPDLTAQELEKIETEIKKIVTNEHVVDIIAGQLRSLKGILNLSKKKDVASNTQLR